MDAILALTAASAAAIVAAPVTGLLGYRQLKRTANAKKMRITSGRGIDEAGYVQIGGIQQWVSVRGDDLANPVIVELHGGPGASNLAYGPRTRAWEKHFTIVRWDMRGAGKTFGHGGPTAQGPMDLDRFYLDALEVTDHVRKRLGVERVLLVANSFGTVIGLRLARNHPDLYSAYVGSDQNVLAGGENLPAYHGLLERLRAQGKRKELAEVEAMGNDATAWTSHQWSKFNKYVVTTDPLTFETMKTVVVRSLWFSPLHTLRALRTFFKGMTFSEQLGPQAMAIDEWEEGTEFPIPIFIFQGDGDVMTPPGPAKRLFDDITAPIKEFAYIREASHFSSFRHPNQFLDLMLTKVRPHIAP